MHIRKARAGSIPGHTWTRDGEVIEVEDHFAEQLLLIPNGGFSIAEAPEPETTEASDEAFDSGEPAEVEDEPSADTKKSPGRPRLPRDAKGNIIRN